MNEYPILERLYDNGYARDDFNKKYPNSFFQSDVALIGITYAGTGELMEAICRNPSVVLVPKIYRAKQRVCLSKKQKIKNFIKKLIGRKVVEYETTQICTHIMNMYMLAKMYLLGLYYPVDSEERGLLSNILRLCPSLVSIPYEGRIVSVLSDTYGFTGGGGFNNIAAFEEPWYYTDKTKFLLMFRDPAEMTYAGFKNEYDRLYWKKKFEDVIDFKWIKSVVIGDQYPAFEEMIEKVHPLLHRGFHKKALELWLNYFPNNQFYIIDNKELALLEEEIINGISQALEISPLIQEKKQDDIGRFSHHFFSFPKISLQTKEILDRFFSHYNDGFDMLLKRCIKINPLTSQERIEKMGRSGINKNDFFLRLKQEAPKSVFLSNLLRWFEAPSLATLLNEDFLSILFDGLCRLELYGYALSLYNLIDSKNKKEELDNILLKRYNIETNHDVVDYDFSHICGNEKLQDEKSRKERYFARFFCYHFLIRKHKKCLEDLIQDWFLK